MINKSMSLMLFVIITVMSTACNTQTAAADRKITQQPKSGTKTYITTEQKFIDDTYVEQDGIDVIYLAGGCFWGIEKLMQSIEGVISATSGYANGEGEEAPTYSSVSTGITGYRETVRVEYDTAIVSIDAILFAYFRVIDPTVENAQGNDIGSQYQTGVYYTDDAAKETVERIAGIERKRNERFVVEIEPLQRFYEAEEYHQDYLDRYPGGYCHIPREEISQVSELIVDPGDYSRPSDEKIKSTLTEQHYWVTQDNATEPPFSNEFYDHHERGIYVDVVTNEPLFSSRDMFDSGTGWPSFSKAIDPNTLILIEDQSQGLRRTEVRSRAGNSHLGHVFYNEGLSPSGTRYCINSAALRFVPYEEMEAEGYGYLIEYVK